MRTKLYALIATIALILSACASTIDTKKLQNGDLIFQTFPSDQSDAIHIATNSKFSHVGIVLEKDGKLRVYEAISPVQITEINSYLNRGARPYFQVMRLKNASEVLTPEVIAKMQKIAESHLGKPYDIMFSMDEEKMYCSEYVWKIYKEATGLEIGKLRKLRDFDLNSPTVQQIMKERYGRNIPYDSLMIAPSEMYNSELLEEVE